jgi:hypothetical protein
MFPQDRLLTRHDQLKARPDLCGEFDPSNGKKQPQIQTIQSLSRIEVRPALISLKLLVLNLLLPGMQRHKAIELSLQKQSNERVKTTNI